MMPRVLPHAICSPSFTFSYISTVGKEERLPRMRRNGAFEEDAEEEVVEEEMEEEMGEIREELGDESTLLLSSA